MSIYFICWIGNLIQYDNYCKSFVRFYSKHIYYKNVLVNAFHIVLIPLTLPKSITHSLDLNQENILTVMGITVLQVMALLTALLFLVTGNLLFPSLQCRYRY